MVSNPTIARSDNRDIVKQLTMEIVEGSMMTLEIRAILNDCANASVMEVEKRERMETVLELKEAVKVRMAEKVYEMDEIKLEISRLERVRRGELKQAKAREKEALRKEKIVREIISEILRKIEREKVVEKRFEMKEVKTEILR